MITHNAFAPHGRQFKCAKLAFQLASATPPYRRHHPASYPHHLMMVCVPAGSGIAIEIEKC